MRSRSREVLLACALWALAGLAYAQAPEADPEPPGPNVALGASYTMTEPNYALTRDPGDDVHLTDGVYTAGHFWTRKTTVGWSGARNIFITLDLGDVYPIAGLSFNTAAGVADVRWPAHILIFVSDDGEHWHGLGDLMEMVGRDTLPEYGTYVVKRLFTHDLRARGRYVQLAMQPGDTYLFVDEIEVYEGLEEYLALELPGESVTDVPAQLQYDFFGMMIREQLRRDLHAVRESVQDPGLPGDDRARFQERISELTAAIRDLPAPPIEGFRAVLPMNDLERDIFRLQAEVWQAQGKSALRVWQAHRWEHLIPSHEPAADALAPVVQTRMMNGEVRADVLNFTSAAGADDVLRLQVSGLPANAPGNLVTVREVLHVGTRRFESVAAALPEAGREGEDWLLDLPAGMTVQAWFEFRPEGLEAGTHEAVVTVRGNHAPTTEVPLRLTISPLQFPERTTLLVGGWDYTDRDSQYGVTPENRDALVEYLVDMRVNLPWATPSAMPEGVFAEDHTFAQTPDTTRFDEWVDRWPNAEVYMVFLAKTEAFAGTRMGTEEFNIRLGNWARFWAGHMRDLGLEPSQLGLLIYDEPHEERGYAISEAWARAMKAAAPELVMFTDPQPYDREKPLAMFDAMDVLCPHRPQWLGSPWFPDLFAAQREQGKELWFYSAHGPARRFDPFSYYLAQAWHVFSIGGRGSSFWAFADTGRVSVWNEYLTAGRGPYAPLYLDDTSVTSGKWMEAVRESAQDFEYLVMLQRRLEELEAEGRGEEAEVQQARELLRDGPAEVLAGERGLNYTWDQPKDRAAADRVRGRVLDALEQL